MSHCSSCGQEIPHKPLNAKHTRWVQEFAAANPSLNMDGIAWQLRFTAEQVREALGREVAE